MKAIITGHSRGLGAALAAELVACGVTVMGLARSGNAALQAHPRLLQQAIDLSDTQALRGWLDAGHLARFTEGEQTVLLINNAATAGPLARAGSAGVDGVRSALALNAVAPLMLAEALLALTPLPGAQRRIMHLSSGASVDACPGWSTYCASKAALDQHARCVALEAAPGVRIASVMPGVIDTGMQEDLRDAGAGFVLRDMFQQLRACGMLQPAQDCARKLAALLLDESFGAAPVLALDAEGQRRPVAPAGTVQVSDATHAC